MQNPRASISEPTEPLKKNEGGDGNKKQDESGKAETPDKKQLNENEGGKVDEKQGKPGKLKKFDTSQLRKESGKKNEKQGEPKKLKTFDENQLTKNEDEKGNEIQLEPGQVKKLDKKQLMRKENGKRKRKQDEPKRLSDDDMQAMIDVIPPTIVKPETMLEKIKNALVSLIPKSVKNFFISSESTGLSAWDLRRKRKPEKVRTKPKRMRQRVPKRVSFRIEPIRLPYIIQFFYKFAEFWEWCGYAMAVISYTFITYVSVFCFYDKVLYEVVFYIDMIFLIDTSIRVMVEIWRYKTKVPCIVFLAPYTFLQYLGDMFSVFPFEMIYVYSSPDLRDNITYLDHVDFFRYNRFIRFWRVYTFLGVALKQGRISEKLAFILEYATMYLAFIHFVSCVYYLLLPASPYDLLLQRKTKGLKKTWIGYMWQKKPNYDIDRFDQYILSLYFGTATVTTTGFGDLTPALILEQLVAIFVMLVGAVILAGLFSSGLANFELNHDAARFDLFFRVNAILENLAYIGTTQLFRNKVEEYYAVLWNYREGVYNVQMLHQLPSSMKSDCLFDVCQEMFHKSVIFRNLDESFLKSVARVVKVVLYNPDMILCAKGAYSINMYYLLQGEISVKSKRNSDCVAAYLRAGCIIGELNLLFSYPYATTLETRSSCQLLMIQKEDFIQVLENYPITNETIRSRMQNRIEHLKTAYELVGTDPVKWIEYKGNLLPGAEKRKNEFPVIMRKATKLNFKVEEDIIDDSLGAIIIDMPCSEPKYQKNHILVYKNCLIPPIYQAKQRWVQLCVKFIIFWILYGAFMGPYCQVFRKASSLDQSICKVDEQLKIPRLLIHCVDMFVEIAYCVPVIGMYYKLSSGFRIKFKDFYFWLDVISGFPFELIGDNTTATGFFLNSVAACFRVLKLWKVIRYFNFLDNKYPAKLFICRILQTTLIILYANHCLACILFAIACPYGLYQKGGVKCKKNSWLRSYEVFSVAPKPQIQLAYVAKELPYLASFYFACAILTSTGFGDFNAQNRNEMILVVIAQLVGFGLIGYYTAILTSALSCIVRPKLLFQQKLVAIRQFLDHHGIDERLQYRVIEHYTLQDQLLCGVNLPRMTTHFMYDAPAYLLEDALFQDVQLLYDGVPILTKVDAKILIEISKVMRRYLIPPGSIFLRKGEVRRQMYLIARGSVGVMQESHAKPIRILEATGHFGLRDLLFGEPAHHNIKTLSFCLLYEIDWHDLAALFEEEPETASLVEEEKTNVTNKNEGKIIRPHTEDQVVPNYITSWITFPKTKAEDMEHSTFAEYEELFENARFKCVYRFLLMPQSIHPAGTFAKWWISITSLITCLTIGSLMLESYMELRAPWFRIFQFCLDLFNYLDVYVKMHWAYYDKRNVLVCHPMMTMLNYVFEGSFVFDVFCTAPFELVISIVTASHILGYAPSAYWYTKLRWTRVGQIIRFPAVVHVCHNIFLWRNTILVSLYTAMTLVLCSAIAAVASNLACPSTPRIWQNNDQLYLPYCPKGTWAYDKTDLLDTFELRWIYGIYYASQVIFGIGFGDMITLNRSELLLLVILMIFGYVLAIIVLSDITAAEVDIDETRAQYLEEMKCLSLVMARENVHSRLFRNVTEHLQHNWVTSKGLQPRQLFYDLHPALEADLFRDYVGDLLKTVPIFIGLSENIVRAICQFMKKVYFLKGERMMRAGNLEFEMYIVVNGKVWILDDEESWFTTLTKGASFGEASMIYGHPRKYSAVAATLVETFVLTSDDFNAVLESYPKLQEEMGGKIQEGSNEDLFEKVFETAMEDPVRKSKYEQRRPFLINHIGQILYSRDNPNLEVKIDYDEYIDDVHVAYFQRFKRRLIGSGSDDDNLSFIYFATKYAKFNFLIHPNCAFMRLFGSIIVWICIITPALASYEMAFSNVSEKTPNDATNIGEYIKLLTMYIEIFMYLHILFQFITPFIMFEGIYCKTFAGIAYNYVTSLTRFPLDIISAIPVSLIIKAQIDTELEDELKLLYLVRFLRLVHFYRVQLSKKDDLSTSAFKYKLTLSISSFMLMIHSLACLFYVLAECKCENSCDVDGKDGWDLPKIRDLCEDGGWTQKFVEVNELDDIKDMAPWKWYIRSLYWVVTSVSTTGFGDITPQNEVETLMAITCIFCGAFILSIILSMFTSGAASRKQAHREFFFKVNLLSKYLSNIGLSTDKKHLLNAYFVMTWDGSRGVSYHDATAILPITMQIEVCHSLYFKCMQDCKLFFHVKDYTFLRQVGVRLKHATYLAGTNIVNEGEQGDRLFIVFKGRVFGYVHGDKAGGIELRKQYEPSQVFGRIPGLFYDMTYTKTYRSENHSEILSLAQEDIINLMKFCPEFRRKLELFMLRRYDTRESSESIFQLRSNRKKIYDVDMKAMAKEFAVHNDETEVEVPMEDFEKKAEIIRKDMQLLEEYKADLLQERKEAAVASEAKGRKKSKKRRKK